MNTLVSQAGSLVYLIPLVVVYFAPTIVGWFRKRSRRTVYIPISLLFFLNLFLGITGIGWIFLWPIALGWTLPQSEAPSIPVPHDRYKPVFGLVPVQPPHRPAPDAPFSPFEWEVSEVSGPCSVCGDSGATCPSCFGSRGTWDLPQTENGVAVFVNCSYCTGTGKVQCSKCGNRSY